MLSGNDAVFHMIKDDKSFGICLLHVDDFLLSETVDFDKLLRDRHHLRFIFGKIEDHKYKSNGLNIQQNNNVIFVNIIDFINSLEPIEIKGWVTTMKN